MAKQTIEVTKLMKHFKEVGYSFAKSMKQMLLNGEIKPPKDYTVEEYIKIIDIAHEEGTLRAGENLNKKNKKVNEITAEKPRD